jgi:teichuronic acid biosynthesis glycosyltransferase TuaH
VSLTGKHIVVFSQMQFDGRLESTIYTMARLLAKDNYVYFVDRPFTWKDYFKFKDTKAYQVRKPHFFNAKNSFIQSDLPNLRWLFARLYHPSTCCQRAKGIVLP